MHESTATDHQATGPDSGRPLTRDELQTITSHLAAQEDFWRPQVVHDPAMRRDVQLLWSPQVEIWLIGWGEGHAEGLHDHGGVTEAFTVCEGVLEVREADSAVRSPDHLRRHLAREGDTVAFTGGDIHHVVNRAAAPATTIHAYSPALTTVRFYETVAGELAVTRREPARDPEPTAVATPVAAGCH